MSSPSRAQRLPRVVLVLMILVVPLLAGCLRYTESLTIHQDDTVSGIIVIAAREPDPVSAPQAPTVPDGASIPEPKSESENILVTPFAHDQESGYKVTFTRAAFDDVAAFAPLGSDGGALLITRYGDQLEILMTIDLTYAMDAAGRAYIAEHADATVSLSVPGEVSETNGEVVGETIRWDLTPFTVNTLSATVDAPAAGATAPEGTRSIDPVRAALLGAGALVVVAVGWLVLRRFAGRPASASTGSPATAATSPVRRTAAASPVRAAAPARGRPGAPPARREPPAAAVPPDPFGESDPVVRSGAPASKVRPGHQIDGGGWPPPRPLWKEHR